MAGDLFKHLEWTRYDIASYGIKFDQSEYCVVFSVLKISQNSLIVHLNLESVRH